MTAATTVPVRGVVATVVALLTPAERLTTRRLVHRAITSRGRLGWPAAPSILTPASGPVPVALAALCLELGDPDGLPCPACTADLIRLGLAESAGEQG